MKGILALCIYSATILILLSSCDATSPSDERELSPAIPYVLENNLIRFQVAVDTGGRIASFQYKGKEVLSQIRDAENFLWGSTIWPAPQAAWNWPPPPAMDQGQYTLTSRTDTEIIVDSPKDAYQGIQLRKKFTLVGTNTIEIEYTFINNSDSTVNAGIWEISRIPFEGKITWKSGPLREHGYTGISQIDSVSSIRLGSQKTPGKLFINSKGGWITYERDGLQFIKHFDIVSAESVAPDQAPIEIYFDPIHHFAEIEQHAAYLALASGERSTFNVRWIVRTIE
jgi:hypothetical protein